MFKGAHVTIMRVVEQLRAGVPLSEITEDYPQLNSAALAYAQTQSRIGKPHGKSSVVLNIKRSAS